MDVIVGLVNSKRSSYDVVVGKTPPTVPVTTNSSPASPSGNSSSEPGNNEIKVHNHSIGVDLLSGAFGGMAVVLSGHPFDTVKVRMQSAAQSGHHFKNSVDCLLKTVKFEGVKGLYKGMSAPLACSTAVDAAFFFVNEQAKQTFQTSPNTPMAIPYFFLAGGVAGGVTSVLTTPMELIKSRLQVQNNKRSAATYTGPIDVLKRTFVAEGFKGLYRGMLPTFMRDVPLIGTYFGVYEISRRALAGWPQTYPYKFNPLITLTAGGIAGIASWALVYPIDGIKSRMQTHIGTPMRAGAVVVHALRDEGLRGLYRGFAPCVLRAFPVNAACFFVFEYSHNVLSQQ